MNGFLLICLLAALVAFGPPAIDRCLGGRRRKPDLLADHWQTVIRDLPFCMARRTGDFPLICGRDADHPGQHIAFGVGHRILATWPDGAGVRLVERRVPGQRDRRGL